VRRPPAPMDRNLDRGGPGACNRPRSRAYKGSQSASGRRTRRVRSGRCLSVALPIPHCARSTATAGSRIGRRTGCCLRTSRSRTGTRARTARAGSTCPAGTGGAPRAARASSTSRAAGTTAATTTTSGQRYGHGCNQEPRREDVLFEQHARNSVLAPPVCLWSNRPLIRRFR